VLGCLLQDNMSAIVVLFENAPQKVEGFTAPETVQDASKVYPSDGDDGEGQAGPPRGGTQFLAGLQALLVGPVG
jgi:hypothetical protein